jgi:hypothetical protein
MSDPLALGERLLGLLEESARTSTYKSALLLALLDGAAEHADEPEVAVRSLAGRVIELYWPQTLDYPTTGAVLIQSQAGAQATIVRDIASYRAERRLTIRSLPEDVRRGPGWTRLVDSVELTLAEWPIPRLQRPYGPFLYSFDWPWVEEIGWSVRAYRSGTRSIRLLPGVAAGLIALGPMLRPFITRWWTDKAAQLNPQVPAARSLLEFEDFLFGRDRVALARIAEDLLSLQHGVCFYCHRQIRRDREIDHFVPWSHCGDDGLDSLVASCRRCNNNKRATLAGPEHLADVIERNARCTTDLGLIAASKRWPRDTERSGASLRVAYLQAPDERPLWTMHGGQPRLLLAGQVRGPINALLRPATQSGAHGAI